MTPKLRSNTSQVDDLVQYVTLHVPISPLLNGCVFPFVIMYTICLYCWFEIYGFEEYKEAGIVTMIGIAFAQLLASLCCFWSVHIRTFMGCRKAKSPETAVRAKVVPTDNNGSAELVLIKKTLSEETKSTSYWFMFQKLKYIWDENKKQFRAMDFPINKTYYEYFNAKGHENESDIILATKTYGTNSMEMAVPEFVTLFVERATAPFFVFQIFSVGLWCLDEYWYYSLFTLVMLIVFECTLVHQQLRNMAEIRKMGNKPYPINVYRNRKWRTISSELLVPGDLISITRSANDNLVPCDVVMIRGTCIVDESMLTGESVPQMKESLENIDNLKQELDVDAEGKLFVLFGGTRVVQHTPPQKGSPMRAPDNGCIGCVLRNGFNTSQGRLLRTILFGVKRVTENNLETFAFILFLLVFAIAAASYVWIKGSEDPERSRYKLFLECTLILTSIIPPDLAIELSLAVNTSLLQLTKLFVYCTEPFRIPFAGKVQICCFDKTGTLTSDNLMVEGVAGLSEDCKTISIADAPDITIQVLATCHSLAQLDDGMVGDPMEKATLTAVDWTLTKQDTVIPKKGKLKPLKIYHRYYFSSALKRMSVLVGQMGQYSNEVSYMGTVKGAPEVIMGMLEKIPADYEKTYLEYARRGARVLALGIKEFGKLDNQAVRELKREDVEKDLTFAGFVVISCPLKPDSKNIIKEIIQSSHKVMMITGDNPLTACHVAKELRFTRKLVLVLTKRSGQWVWQSIDGNAHMEIDEKIVIVKQLVKEFDLCITGEGLLWMDDNMHEYLIKVLPYVTVFARFAPKQKEYIITSLKHLGYYTLMCGDGTNDVGALKHAHVGVSLMSGSGMPIKKEKLAAIQNGPATDEAVPASPPARATNNATERHRGGNRSGGGVERANVTPRDRAIARNRENLANAQDMLQKARKDLEELDPVQVVKLGDASIAAPFTSKGTSILCVCHIIKQGRCTLVTTLQMFKILALNALISAYCQSVLYVDGVKFSDTQATLQGVSIAACFLFITKSRPLKVLSKQAPLPNIFNLYTVMTILCQFAVHFTCLLYLVQEATLLSPPRTEKVKLNIDLKPDEKEEFAPNIINSTVFIIGLALQVSTFAVNYKGHPFMESLRENRLLMYSIAASAGIVCCLAFGLSPDIVSMFEIVEFPEDFRKVLIAVLLADTVFAYLLDRACSFLFGEIRRKSDLVN